MIHLGEHLRPITIRHLKIFHAVGSPLIFETAVLTLAILYTLTSKFGFKLPSGPNSGKFEEDEVKTPSAILVLIVSGIYALSAFLDAILHISGVEVNYQVKFVRTILFLGAVRF